MALGISLSLVAIIGIIYGKIKNNKTVVIASVVALSIIAVIWLVYSYLYSLTPY